MNVETVKDFSFGFQTSTQSEHKQSICMLNICSSQKSSTRQAFSSSGTVRGDNIRPMVWLLVEDWKRVFGSIVYFRFWQSYVTTNGVLEYSGRFYRYESHVHATKYFKKCQWHLDHPTNLDHSNSPETTWCLRWPPRLCVGGCWMNTTVGCISPEFWASLLQSNIVQKDIYMNY